MRLLEHASDHPDLVVCVSCVEECDAAMPAVIFAKGYVSGARAGLCHECMEEARELLHPKDVSEDDG